MAAPSSIGSIGVGFADLPRADTTLGGTMAALPQWAVTEPSEPLAQRPVTVFRVRRGALPPHWYRNRPLVRLSCPSPPELPPRPTDPPQIHLVAPIPGLDELDDDNDFVDDEDGEDFDDSYDDDLVEDEPRLDADEIDDGDYEDWIEDDRAEDDLEQGDMVEDGLDQDDLDQEGLDEDDLDQDGLEEDDLDQDDPDEVVFAPPAVVARREQHRSSSPTPPAKRNPGPLLIVALIVAVVIALGATGVALRRNLSSSGSAPVSTISPANGPELAAATGWLRGSLPTTAVVATDAVTRQQLIQAGFPSIQLTDITAAASRARYAVITPAVRAAAATPGSQLATLLSQALPVAVFGDGQARVEISQLGAMGTSLTTAQQARTMAGQALIRNPGLHIVTNLTSTVADGRLDMRAATLLAVLAGQRSTALLKLPQAGAESRAGAPIRTIVLELAGDPTTADQLLGRTVRALSPSLAPYQTVRQPDGSYQVVWLPDLTLTPPVN